MRTRKFFFFPRFLALFLTVSLTLPSPALGLRPQAGLESTTKSGLEASLLEEARPTAYSGLEEGPRLELPRNLLIPLRIGGRNLRLGFVFESKGFIQRGHGTLGGYILYIRDLDQYFLLVRSRLIKGIFRSEGTEGVRGFLQKRFNLLSQRGHTTGGFPLVALPKRRALLIPRDQVNSLLNDPSLTPDRIVENAVVLTVLESRDRSAHFTLTPGEIRVNGQRVEPGTTRRLSEGDQIELLPTTGPSAKPWAGLEEGLDPRAALLLGRLLREGEGLTEQERVQLLGERVPQLTPQGRLAFLRALLWFLSSEYPHVQATWRAIWTPPYSDSGVKLATSWVEAVRSLGEGPMVEDGIFCFYCAVGYLGREMPTGQMANWLLELGKSSTPRDTQRISTNGMVALISNTAMEMLSYSLEVRRRLEGKKDVAGVDHLRLANFFEHIAERNLRTVEEAKKEEASLGPLAQFFSAMGHLQHSYACLLRLVAAEHYLTYTKKKPRKQGRELRSILRPVSIIVWDPSRAAVHDWVRQLAQLVNEQGARQSTAKQALGYLERQLGKLFQGSDLYRLLYLEVTSDVLEIASRYHAAREDLQESLGLSNRSDKLRSELKALRHRRQQQILAEIQAKLDSGKPPTAGPPTPDDTKQAGLEEDRDPELERIRRENRQWDLELIRRLKSRRRSQVEEAVSEIEQMLFSTYRLNRAQSFLTPVGQEMPSLYYYQGELETADLNQLLEAIRWLRDFPRELDNHLGYVESSYPWLTQLILDATREGVDLYRDSNTQALMERWREESRRLYIELGFMRTFQSSLIQRLTASSPEVLARLDESRGQEVKAELERAIHMAQHYWGQQQKQEGKFEETDLILRTQPAFPRPRFTRRDLFAWAVGVATGVAAAKLAEVAGLFSSPPDANTPAEILPFATVKEAEETLQRLAKTWNLTQFPDLRVLAVTPDILQINPRLQGLLGKPVALGNASFLVVPRQAQEMDQILKRLKEEPRFVTIQGFGSPEDPALDAFEASASSQGLSVTDRIPLTSQTFREILRQLIANLSGLPATSIRSQDLIDLQQALLTLA